MKTSRYRADLAAQRAQYEQQLKGLADERRRMLDDQERAIADIRQVQVDLQSRLQQLGTALAEKQRLLDAPASATNGDHKALRVTVARAFGGEVDLDTAQSGVVVTVQSDSLFARGSTRLSDEASRVIEAIATAVRETPRYRLAIDVHSDAVGTETWAVTQRQGLTILRQLVASGTDPSRLAVAAFGQFSPRSTNDTETGRAKNRRIELRFFRAAFPHRESVKRLKP